MPMSKAVAIGILTALILTLVPALAGEQRAPAARILFILDASGSMWGKLDGKEKIVIAREVMEELINGLPEGVHVGLEVYGHRRKGDCEDIE